MKYFRWTEEYILSSSWIKMLMYSATIPDYGIKKNTAKGGGVTKLADGGDLAKYL